MNIFALDNDPTICAKYHSNFHIAKMSEKYLVMLEGWMLENKNNYRFNLKKTTGLSVYNHKVNDWLDESPDNVIWFTSLILNVYKEYIVRFKKAHVLHDLMNRMMFEVLDYFQTNEITFNRDNHTEFPKIMPETYIAFESSVDCYRYYYVQSKKNFLNYSTEKPEFLSMSKYTTKVYGFEANSKLSKMVAKYKDRSITPEEKQTILSFIEREAKAQNLPIDFILYNRYEKRNDYYFKYSNKLEDTLFTSLVSHVFGDIPIYYGSSNKRVQKWRLQLTVSEYNNFNNIYEFHRAKLKDEYKKMMSSLAVAYISKQGIENRDDLDFDYTNEYDKKGNKIISKSDKDFDTWVAINLSNNMDKHQYLDGIE